MIKRILITGATGYIGSNLARHLLNRGYEVHAIVRGSSKLHLIEDISDKLKLHVFNGQTSGLYKIFHAAGPSLVIHLASRFVSEHKQEDIEDLINSNVLFGTQLLDAASAYGVKYFINTGTVWQNYMGEEYNPVNLYAATKQAFEAMAKFYLESSGMRMITLKLMDTYGPFDPRPKLINLLKKIAVSGEKLDMSSGEQEIGLLYIEDVVRGYGSATDLVQKLEAGDHRTYLLAPEKYYKLRDVVRIFEEVSGKRLNISWGARSYRNRELMQIPANAPPIPGGGGQVSLEEGIRKMLELEGFAKL